MLGKRVSGNQFFKIFWGKGPQTPRPWASRLSRSRATGSAGRRSADFNPVLLQLRLQSFTLKQLFSEESCSVVGMPGRRGSFRNCTAIFTIVTEILEKHACASSPNRFHPARLCLPEMQSKVTANCDNFSHTEYKTLGAMGTFFLKKTTKRTEIHLKSCISSIFNGGAT